MNIIVDAIFRCLLGAAFTVALVFSPKLLTEAVQGALEELMGERRR